jgi:hypothetical protein
VGAIRNQTLNLFGFLSFDFRFSAATCAFRHFLTTNHVHSHKRFIFNQLRIFSEKRNCLLKTFLFCREKPLRGLRENRSGLSLSPIQPCLAWLWLISPRSPA